MSAAKVFERAAGCTCDAADSPRDRCNKRIMRCNGAIAEWQKERREAEARKAAQAEPGASRKGAER